MSLCSKKSSQIAKSLRNKSKKVKVKFCNGSFARVWIRSDNRECHELLFPFDDHELPKGQHEQLKIGDMIVPITKGRGDSLNTYWKDQFVGITKILDTVTDFFDSPIHELILNAEKHPNDPRNIVDYVMSRQESISDVFFDCDKTTDEGLKHFLDTCKITDSLHLAVETSEHFQHRINFQLESIALNYAQWLTLDNLFSLNCRYIEVDNNKRYTGNDVNAFLSHWINGGSSRLGILFLEMDNPDISVITAGLNAARRNYIKKRVFKFSDDNDRIVFKNSYDIRRNDSVMASIVHCSNAIKFLVWPDWDNQPYFQ